MNSLLQSLASRMGNSINDEFSAVTENIANHDMPGFQKCLAIHQRIDSSGQEVPVSPEMTTDFSSGHLKHTGNTLDFCLQGDGYFEVQKDQSVYYTRNGQFTTAPDGTLMTHAGMTVMGTGGPIVIPADSDRSAITVDTDGIIRSAEQSIGQLRLVSFSNPETLMRAGTTLMMPTEQTEQKTSESTSVSNRVLESSNTNIYEEMSHLITLTRYFEMCQKIIRSRDSAEGEMIKSYG